MLKKVLISLFILISLLSGCTTTQSTKNNKNQKQMSKEEKEEVYLIIRGISLAENGKLEEALKVFKEGYTKNPKNIKTVRYLALCYSRLGDTPNGKKYFEEALKIDKNDTESLYNYAVLCYGNKEYEKSKEILERIKIESIDKKIILAKGYVYYQLNEYQNSYDEFSKIVEDGTDYSIEVYSIYTETMKKVDKNDKIYPFLQSKYMKDINNYQKVDLFVKYLIDVKAYDEAEKILKNYGKDNSYPKSVLLALAELMLIKEDYEQTKTYVTLLDDKNSMDTDVMNFKVKYFRVLGMEEEAKNIEKIISNMSGIEK